MIYETTVPNQNTDNLIKIAAAFSGEGDYQGVIARHQATVAAVDGVKYIGLDGKPYVGKLDKSYDNSDLKALELAILAMAHKSRCEGGLGCIPKGDNYDGGGVSVIADAANVRITIDSDIEITALTNEGTDTVADRYTDTQLVQISTTSFVSGVAVGDLDYNGTKSTIADFTAAAPLKAAIDAAMVAVGAEGESTVVLNGSSLDVTIKSAQYPLSFNGIRTISQRVVTAFFDGGVEVSELKAAKKKTTRKKAAAKK